MPNRLLRWFEYKHLPESWHVASGPIHEVAHAMDRLWVVLREELIDADPPRERTWCLPE